ncbi:MAG: hypothetical protein JKY37_10905 [Nannocystaceae bacterium]|nr:hypothetical protein [Nannocystaceae bacterium]
MGWCARAAAAITVVCLGVPVCASAATSQRKLGVDPRQSGLDVAFVPEPRRSDLDRFRLHFGVDLANWLRSTPWPHTGTTTVGPRDDPAFLGYRRLGLGLGIGHGFADAWVAGVRFEYEITRGMQRTPWKAEKSARSVGLSAMPYLEVMMARNARVRPYLMVRGGLGGSLVTTDGSSPLERQAGRTLSLIHPSIGVGTGAHAFISPEVSLDGSVTLDHRWEFARHPGALPDAAGLAMGEIAVVKQAAHRPFGRRFSTALVISVSRWF